MSHLFTILSLIPILLCLVSGAIQEPEGEKPEYDQVTVIPEPRKSQPETGNRRTNYQPLCVSLSPEYVSSREGQYVTFECLASVCPPQQSTDSDDYTLNKDQITVDDNNSIDDNNTGNDKDNTLPEKTPKKETTQDTVKMFRPLFDWNTELYHLLTTSGKCDSSNKNCWSRIEINVQDLLEEMKEDGLKELQIECAVADLISNKTEKHGAVYLFGKSMSILKQFSGKRIHEKCEQDKECGENMICLKQPEVDTKMTKPEVADDQKLKPETDVEKRQTTEVTENLKTMIGYCECMPSQTSSELETLESSLILLTDTFYNEQICLPVRGFNQSCNYDQQCQITDVSLECRFNQNAEQQKNILEQNHPDEVFRKFCLCKTDQYWSGGMCIEKSNFQQSQNNDENPGSKQRVWWIIGSIDDPSVVERHVQLPYFSMIQFLTGLLFLIPITVIIFTVYLTCRTKCYRKKQSSKWNGPYPHSTTNFYRGPSQVDESYYYGEVKNHKSILPKISEMKIIKAHQAKKEDKQDLIDADQLDHRNQV